MQKFSTESNKESGGNFKQKMVLVLLIVVVMLILIFNSFSVVNEGFIGVKYRFGKIVNSSLTAGLNFHIPFMEEIRPVDVREQVYEVETDAYTSDTQTVDELRLKLNYCYDGSQLPEIIRSIGVENVVSKLLVPNVAKISKDEIGKVKAEDLVQNRSTVQNAIYESLKETLEGQGVLVTAFAIENISFDDAFEQSIQAKVIAAQDALKMQNKTAEREEEAKQKVIAAQAEADSQKIKADAEAYAIRQVQEQLTNSPNYIDYMKIQQWDGKLPAAVGDVNPFIAIDGTASTASGTSGAGNRPSGNTNVSADE